MKKRGNLGLSSIGCNPLTREQRMLWYVFLSAFYFYFLLEEEEEEEEEEGINPSPLFSSLLLLTSI